MLNSKEIERIVQETFGEIEGYEIGESISMYQDEIIEGEVIKEEDLHDFQDNVMTHTSCFESETFPDEDMILVAVIEDTKERLLLCLITDECMEKVIKKQLVKY